MGLLFRPQRLTPTAIGGLSRNCKTVVAFVDGSASIPADWAGVGVVLKFGKYTVELGQPLKPRVGSYLAELRAIEAALDLIPTNKRLVIRSDCLNLVDVLNGLPRRIRRMPAAIARVQRKMNGRDVELRFIPRKPSPHPHNIADRLAHSARVEGRKFFRVTAA